MISMLHQYRAWLAPLLTLFAVLFLLAVIFIPLNAKQAKYNEIIQKSQPRIERVQGLIQAAPQLEFQLIKARASAKQQLYPGGSDDNRFNTELQTRLRTLAQQNGLTLASIRALPSRKEHDLDVILLNLNLQGGIKELRNYLYGLQLPSDSEPMLYIDTLTLRRNNIAPDSPQTLSIDITVAALRVASTQSTSPTNTRP
jgi:hypothetical protein